MELSINDKLNAKGIFEGDENIKVLYMNTKGEFFTKKNYAENSIKGKPVHEIKKTDVVTIFAEIPKAKKKAAPKAKKKAAPEAKKEAAPEAKKEAAPEAKKEAAPEAKKEAAPEAKKEAAPEAKKEAAPEAKG